MASLDQDTGICPTGKSGLLWWFIGSISLIRAFSVLGTVVAPGF